MPPELLALIAACCYASAHVAVKFGTQEGPIVLGLLISQATGVLALAALVVATVDTWDIPMVSVGVFAVAGVAGPGIGRALGMRSIRDAGTTVTVPVQASTAPVISTIAGALLFHETVGLDRVVALALIVAGIWFCVIGGTANRTLVAESTGEVKPALLTNLIVIIPLLSGAAYATSDVVRKFALTAHGDVVLGALIGLTAAFTMWLVVFLVTPRYRQGLRSLSGSGWFYLSGIFSAGAQVSLMSALNTGDLSSVAPIAASQPIIVVILGALVLRKLEHLRPGTIVGAAIAFLGVAYLSLG